MFQRGQNENQVRILKLLLLILGQLSNFPLTCISHEDVVLIKQRQFWFYSLIEVDVVDDLCLTSFPYTKKIPVNN